jgi:hypothetical protein
MRKDKEHDAPEEEAREEAMARRDALRKANATERKPGAGFGAVKDEAVKDE